MQTRLSLQRRTRFVLLGLAAAFLFVLFLAIRSISADLNVSPASSAAVWALGGLFLGLGLLVLVRPILIPWTVVKTARAWRRAFPPLVRYEPALPVAAQPSPLISSSLQDMMEASDAAVLRAQEVQEILDAARAIPPKPIHVQERDLSP